MLYETMNVTRLKSLKKFENTVQKWKGHNTLDESRESTASRYKGEVLAH